MKSKVRLLSFVVPETKMHVKEKYKQRMLTFIQNSDEQKKIILTKETIVHLVPLCYSFCVI